MEITPNLNVDQIRADTHIFEVLQNGLVIIRDKSNNSFIWIPMGPPQYLSEEDLAYVRKFYSENRTFTPEEKKMLNAIVVSPDPQLLDLNCAAVIRWYESAEKYTGPIATKPNLQDLKNPLYWNDCPVEVELKTREVYSCAVVSKRVPYIGIGRDNLTKRILLSEVSEVRISPYAVSKSVLEVARTEGTEVHMGDGYYVAEANGNHYAVDMYYDVRPQSLFFRHGNIKGSDLKKISQEINDPVLSEAIFSEPIEYVVIDGLW
jgi:hypothetical protein